MQVDVKLFIAVLYLCNVLLCITVVLHGPTQVLCILVKQTCILHGVVGKFTLVVTSTFGHLVCVM